MPSLASQIHGRSRLQRYHRAANWEYILQVARAQDPSRPLLPIIGNGDIFSWEDWREHQSSIRDNLDGPPTELGLTSCAMLGRGSLIKPWLPAEIKEGRIIDISASERLDVIKKFW